MKLKIKELHIIKRRKIWYGISILIILAGLISFFIQGFNFGIDFTGGSYLQLTFYQADSDNTASDSNVKGVQISMEDLRAVINKYVEHTPSIQYDETNKSYVIRTDITEKEDVDTLLSAVKSTIGPFNVERNELIGPTIGSELTQKALEALAIAAVLMLIYITVRFRFYFGLASIITLVHDALIVLSVFTIFQFEISSSFIAAILTVIGYSINATIIVFDRVRENQPNYKAGDFSVLLDDSVTQTFARTVNTTWATLLTLLALIVFGGDTTKIFVLAMIIGILAGLYSSICLSCSLFYDLQTHFGDKKKGKNKNKAAIKGDKKQTA